MSQRLHSFISSFITHHPACAVCAVWFAGIVGGVGVLPALYPDYHDTINQSLIVSNHFSGVVFCSILPLLIIWTLAYFRLYRILLIPVFFDALIFGYCYFTVYFAFSGYSWVMAFILLFAKTGCIFLSLLRCLYLPRQFPKSIQYGLLIAALVICLADRFVICPLFSL